MTDASKNFNLAINDAEELLTCYDTLNSTKSLTPPEALKRSALIMVITAWETYVEDLAREVFNRKFGALEGCQIGRFMEKQFTQHLNRFHNPDAGKTREMFDEFFAVDISEHWTWDSYQTPKQVSTVLNSYIRKRGEAVHRSQPDKQSTHIVKREELNKCLLFFKRLVEATDRAAKCI